jgi:endonuclease-8
MFGSYTVNKPKVDRVPRLHLSFSNGDWYNYTCSVKILEDMDLDAIYDWSADVMQDAWDPAKAKKKLKSKPDAMVCDALLEQDIFSGVGNIIKNEVLYRIRVHPETRVGDLPPKKLSELVKEARQYSFDFFHWKKDFVLRKHWLAHKKVNCATCEAKLIKKHTGVKNRRSFYCENCQVKY